MKIEKKEIIKDALLIGIGAFIYSFGFNYFYLANKLADGGLSGISVIINHFTGWSVSIVYFMLNIPLIIIGWRFVGKRFMVKTFYGIIMVSSSMRLFEPYGYVLSDRILASIFGGIVTGIGLGVIFAGGGSSGGSDIIVKILNKYFNVPVGKGFLCIDIIVLSGLGVLLGKDVVMYTLIGMFISTSVIDYVQNGFYKTKAVMIISDKSQEIAQAILDDIGRGATIFEAKGAYTGASKNVIYCILTRSELSQARREVKKIDRNAFLTITDVSEVMGEGFRSMGK